MSEQKIPIPAMLYNAAVGGHVTSSQQIIDENLNREQNDINQETVGAVPYNSTTPNGMGRIVLKKTDDFKEVVEAQTNGNTIFVIKYDFTLSDDVTIPANCVLEFEGGSINGQVAVDLNNAKIIGERCFDYTITLQHVNDYIVFDWFKNEKWTNISVYNAFINGITDGTPTTVPTPTQNISEINRTICENNPGKILFGCGIYPFDDGISIGGAFGKGKYNTLLWFPLSEGLSTESHFDMSDIRVEAKEQALILERNVHAVADVNVRYSAIISYTNHAVYSPLTTITCMTFFDEVQLRGGAGKSSVYGFRSTTNNQNRVFHGNQFFNYRETIGILAPMKACYQNSCVYLDHCSVDAGKSCDYFVYYDNDYPIDNLAYCYVFYCTLEATNCKGFFRNESQSPITLKYDYNEIYGSFDLEYGVQIYSPYALIKLTTNTFEFGNHMLVKNVANNTDKVLVAALPSTRNMDNCTADFWIVPPRTSTASAPTTMLAYDNHHDAEIVVNVIGGDLANLSKITQMLTYYTGNQYQYVVRCNRITNSLLKVNNRVWIFNNKDGVATPFAYCDGTFANKPSSKYIAPGYAYFCTDKQTTEGGTNGIMIYFKGVDKTDPNNPVDIWVDALGRIIS